MQTPMQQVDLYCRDFKQLSKVTLGKDGCPHFSLLPHSDHFISPTFFSVNTEAEYQLMKKIGNLHANASLLSVNHKSSRFYYFANPKSDYHSIAYTDALAILAFFPESTSSFSDVDISVDEKSDFFLKHKMASSFNGKDIAFFLALCWNFTLTGVTLTKGHEACPLDLSKFTCKQVLQMLTSPSTQQPSTPPQQTSPPTLPPQRTSPPTSLPQTSPPPLSRANLPTPKSSTSSTHTTPKRSTPLPTEEEVTHFYLCYPVVSTFFEKLILPPSPPDFANNVTLHTQTAVIESALLQHPTGFILELIRYDIRPLSNQERNDIYKYARSLSAQIVILTKHETHNLDIWFIRKMPAT